jgi:glycosyltransferase involved in cell wall biosynthesis
MLDVNAARILQVDKMTKKKTRILFCDENFFPVTPRSRGGQVSLHNLLMQLAKSYEVHAVFCGDSDKEFKYHRIFLHQLKCKFPTKPFWVSSYLLYEFWKKNISRILDAIQPQLVITQYTAAPAVVDACLKRGIKVVYFIHDFSELKQIPISKKITLKDITQLPFVVSSVLRTKKALRQAWKIVVVSKFMKKVVKEFCNRRAEIVYPFLDFANVKIKKKNPKYITFISPDEFKGVDLFAELAKRNPNFKFLVVGKGSSTGIKKIKALRNVSYLGFIKNLKRVFAKTRILLVPSIYYEGFGMTVVEAAINGIPSIASDRGGLPEAVGDGGMLVGVNDVKGWQKALEKLYFEKKFYAMLSKKAIEHAQLFDSKKQIEKFKKVVGL